jgi:hypothetical protein
MLAATAQADLEFEDQRSTESEFSVYDNYIELFFFGTSAASAHDGVNNDDVRDDGLLAIHGS